MRIGIDLGGTKTEAILLDYNGKKLFSKRIPTIKNYEGTIKGLINLIKEIELNFTKIDSIGVGMPGAISTETSLIKSANSVWMNGKPFKADLEKILKKNVKIENDANCFSLSEAVDGAGKNHKIVYGVILGTGTGSGIVINQKIHRGKNRAAGEFGDNFLPRSSDKEINLAEKCYCGLNGCIETFLSGPGFANIFNKSYKTNFKSEEIVKLHSQNDERAVQSLNDYIDRLARALSDVINILDPDIIVLGGGMSNIEYIYETINEKLLKYVFSDVVNTRVVKNIHGDSGGVRGAAWL